MNWKIIGALSLVMLGVITLGTLHGRTRPSVEATVPVTVAVAKVVREDLAQEQTFEAEFRPYQEIDLHAKVAGYLKEKVTAEVRGEIKSLIDDYRAGRLGTIPAVHGAPTTIQESRPAGSDRRT